jgi:hypothetical protein
MARKGDGVGISRPFEHDDGCADCSADGRFEQEWDVPEQWTSLFLSAVSDAHGARAYLRKQRGASRVVVVRARELATLTKIEEAFRRLWPALGQALAKALFEFCESQVKPAAKR